MLDRISQQLASVGNQISTNFTPPSPYPTFHASASDRRVNILWIISLVCSLSAALLATLVQQWYRAYMGVFQQSRSPLMVARVQLFLFDGIERLPMVAEAVPGLIHISVTLFFCGLGDIILQIDTAVFVAALVPLIVGVCLYLYCVIAPIRNPQSPYRTPFSSFIWYLFQKLHQIPCYNNFRCGLVKPASVEVRQDQAAMKGAGERKKRDVRAIQWLVDNINGSNETEALVLAIPGSFNQEWGRDVWKEVVRGDQSTTTVDFQIQNLPSLPSPREGSQGTAVYHLCKYVRYTLETYSTRGYFMDAKEQRKGMLGCVETAASLVCCTELDVGVFGEVGKVLAELGDKERTNDTSTISSNTSFTVHWTCLSLVAIWKKLTLIGSDDGLQELARFALDGMVRFQGGHGDLPTKLLTASRKIDNYLKNAWTPVVDLHLAFELGSQNRTDLEIKEVLRSHEASILELERIEIEAAGVGNLDWRISFLQDAMDKTTYKLTRRLPGVLFSELRPTAPIMIREAFGSYSVINNISPTSPLLIFPGQEIQSLCSLGRRLRDIIEDRNTEMHEETLKSLASLREIPAAARGLGHTMKRQLWRLMDLQNGSGLGFIIELFFLAIRQLELSSTSSSSELKKVFYTSTFKTITSSWEKSKNSVGTQRVLLDLLCDLVARSRGVFSNFSYPPDIVEMLLDLVGRMVKGHGGLLLHVNDIIEELKDDTLWDRFNHGLRDRALSAIGPSYDTHSEDSDPLPMSIVLPPAVGGAPFLDLEAGGGGQ